MSEALLDVYFLLNSDIEPEDIKFYVELRGWESNKIDLFINFADPLHISQGEERDMIQIKFKQGSKLLRTTDGKEIDTSGILIQKTIPRLLPKDVHFEFLKDNADTIYDCI